MNRPLRLAMTGRALVHEQQRIFATDFIRIIKFLK